MSVTHSNLKKYANIYSVLMPTDYIVYTLGNSLSAILDGEARLTFLNRGEDYVMNMPYAHCKGQSACYTSWSHFSSAFLCSYKIY